MNEYNEWRVQQGLPPLVEAPAVPDGVKTPKRAHMFHLTDECWEGLKIIAFEAGYNNVTALIEGIGVRKWP